MKYVNDFAWDSEAGHKDSRATFDNALNIFFKLTWDGCQQVNAEGLVREFVYCGDFFVELARTHRSGTKCSDSAGFTDSCNEFVIRNAAHSREHDGMFNIEQIG